MKVITVEEHFESAKVTQAMAAAAGQQSRPTVSSEMAHYMQTTLPTPAIMQDVAKDRLEIMDRYDIDMQVLSYGNAQPQNLAPKDAVPLSQLANDELAKAIQVAPTRYAGLAVLPVGDPQAAAQELHRAVEQLGLKGVLLKGNYAGKFFDDPFFFPIFQAAADLNVPVYFHPSFVPPVITQHYFESDHWSEVVSGIFGSAGYGWHMDVGIQVMRMILSGIFDKLPNLKLVSGHWGELVPMFLERLDDELDQYAGLKRHFSAYYRDNVYVTPSGILSQPQLNFLLEEVGAEHILYSIDYPYKQPESAATFLTDAKLSVSQREAIAHGNAERVFNLN
ncbi:amidohydrolase family protein [Lacticaseibacillus hegangensis]|uniref:Amidohydrolase family protein n=1 Tax=Lacticaseibacillus hegangensis TaxID=2486010 RepID=A0ABW4CXG1_9LACO|nr:amidohydrolase family protein [Lacticaseibacillus hegangensis]